MTTFADQLKAFATKVEARTQAVFVNTASAAKESIVNGSPVTGSPGQPVDIGTLKGSWNLMFETPTSALISTNVKWAPPNEYGITEDGRPYTQRSPVGGRHSVALTVAGLQSLANFEAAKLGEG